MVGEKSGDVACGPEAEAAVDQVGDAAALRAAGAGEAGPAPVPPQIVS